MKLALDTISDPAKGQTAQRIIRAVDTGRAIVSPQGRAFIADIVKDLRQKRKVKSSK